MSRRRNGCAGARRAVRAAALAAVVFGAPRAAAGGTLDMSGPDKMILGQDATADITLSNPGKAVSTFVNVGTLSEIVETHGVLRTTYTPPETRFPQVAIIVAVSDDRSIVDWIAIPLHAQPTFTIDSERNTEVVVQVAGVEYGPVKTNRKGSGKVDIEVPPGVDEAVVVARDKLGNEKTTSHSLGVPAFQRLTAVCPTDDQPLLIVAVNDSGKPDDRAQFDLGASPGQLEPATMTAPGVYSSRFVVTDDVAMADEAELTATLRGASASSISCRAPIPRELPDGVAVTFDRASFVAGSGASVAVTIEFAYPGKRLPKVVLPRLAPELGTVSDPETVTQSQYRATWTLPDEFDGRRGATLRVDIADSSQVEGSNVLDLLPAAVARLEATADKTSVRADGSSTLTVRVRPFDGFGNPIRNVELSARGEGRVGTFVANDDGALVATYTPPTRYERDTDGLTISETSTGVETAVSISLLPVPRPFLASARIGYVTNFGVISTGLFAADLAVRLPVLARHVSFGVESGYYATTDTQLREDGTEEVELAVQAVPLLARLAYHIDSLPVVISVGAGAGLVFARRRIESPRSGMRVVSGPRFAAAGHLGLGKNLGPGIAVVEAAYWYSGVSDSGLEGNIGGLRVTAGYGLDF